MTNPATPPGFQTFTRWLAATQSLVPEVTAVSSVYGRVLSAARTARDETLRCMPRVPHQLETLQLLAAATSDEGDRPPELTTARGFRVTLAYEEGDTPGSSSIAVLVQCPADIVASVQGETAYLWNGSERFALGQFDTDGKALGTLPAGVEISLSDFKQGKVKLEEPSSPAE
jgi:hypothetical protein